MEMGESLLYKADDLQTLRTSYDLRFRSEESNATIGVENIQTTLCIANDAWGRSGKHQPALISTSASLATVFALAARTDTVATGTIHYGTLSKAILEICQKYKHDDAKSTTMVEFLDEIYCKLIDDPNGKTVQRSSILSKNVNGLELKVFLPKASLLGSGVSLRTHRIFTADMPSVQHLSSVLEIHELKIPTLIGVNPNERLAKQMVIANLSVEPWLCHTDLYNELEQVVVKSIEESSFQTLESLATHVCLRVLEYFIVPHFPWGVAHSLEPQEGGKITMWQNIRVSLKKPTAVALAEAPCVSMSINSNPKHNLAVNKVWSDTPTTSKPPFPLQGRLDDWIKLQQEEAASKPLTRSLPIQR